MKKLYISLFIVVFILLASSLTVFAADDTEAPVFDPSIQTMYVLKRVDDGTPFVPEDIIKDVTATDNVDGKDVKISLDFNGVDISQDGQYQLLYTATDKSGNLSEKVVNVNIVERERLKYYAEIIRNYNTVIIYELDDNKEYTKIAKVFPCSTGRNGRTPTGIFYTTKGSAWGPLMGGVWGQYYTVITNNILFHSVPYYSTSKDSLEWEEYNKLGDFASAGCVRLSVADAKWMYDNCPNQMKVKIYDGELPPGIEKPIPLKIDGNSPNRGWDPTDPDVYNPWNNLN